MRATLRALLALSAVALWTCEDATSVSETVDPWNLGVLGPSPALVEQRPAVCGAATLTRLIADETVPVGTVEVTQNAAHLYVTLRTDEGWPITKSAVFVGVAAVEVPLSGGGNPKIGQFPYKSAHDDRNEVTWEIARSSLAGDDVIVAAFAEVNKEGAWGEGPVISQGGNWAMYLTHTISNCAVETVGAPGAILTTPDGNATLSIPPEALSAPVDIAIDPATVEEIQEHVAQRGGGAAAVAAGPTSDDAAAAATDPLPTILGLIPLEGTLWDFGPDGLQFDKPVTVTLHYEDSKIPFGFDESELGVFIINGVIPYLPAPSFVDPVANTVTATIEHFSYGFIAVRPPAEADLSVSALVESADVIELGQSITYTATLSNFGPSGVTDGEVYYQGFGDVVAGPLEPGCNLNPLSGLATVRIDCEVGEVASGESAVAPSATFVPQILGDAFTVWVDPVSQESDDPLQANNRAEATYSVVSPSADLAVQTFFDAPDPVAAGENVKYTVDVTVSDAAQPVEGATLLLDVTDATFVSASDEGCFATTQGVTCPLPTLPDGIIEGIEVTLLPDPDVTGLTVTARVKLPLGTTDPDTDNNFAIETTTIGSGGSADLSITDVFESADPVDPGDQVAYAATLRNLGPDPVSDAVVYYQMFGDVEAGPMGPECTQTSAPAVADIEIVCEVGEVDADGVATAPPVIFVPQVPGEYTVWVNPGASAADPDPTNNRFETTLTVNGTSADLRVDRIDDSPDPATAGGVVTYEIDVAVYNTTVAVENAVLQVLFTGDVSLASSNTPCSPIAGGVACPLQFVIPGVGWTVQLVTALPTEGEVVATATIIAPAGVTDPDPTNNSMFETTTVGAPPSSEIAVGDLIEGLLPLGGDTTKYSLQLGAPQTIRVHLAYLSSIGSADLVVRAAGADTTIVPSGSVPVRASDLLSRSEVLSLPAGAYTVAVVSLGSGQPYRLGVGTGEGRLDTSYGTQLTGFVYGPRTDNAFLDMAVVGDAVVVLGQDALSKFDAGGVPDASFGSAGTVDLAAALNGTATAMARQPDGRFVVSGRRLVSPYPWVVARFEANGAIDPTFGTNGIVELTTFGDRSTSHPQGVGFQQNGPDLDIVVAGNAGDLQNQIGIARLDPNGAMDTAFGTGGIVFENGGFAPDGMEIQPDGRILVTDIAQVRRYTASGARDASFGTDGLVTYGADVAARGVYVMSDGTLLVVGHQFNDALAMRLTSSGALDGSFGSGGMQLYDFALPEQFVAVTEMGGGDLLFAGHQRTVDNFWEFLLVRTSATGVLDPNFGVVGYTLERRGDEARAVGFDTQGRLLVGGQQMGAANAIQLSRHFVN